MCCGLIEIPNTAFKDSADNTYAGISDTTTWSFTTIANVAPTLTSAVADQTVNDTATIKPFSSIELADSESDNLSISITLDDDTKGTLSDDTIASGTIADVQALLRDIVFTPTANHITAGTTETTTFTITVSDGVSNTVNTTSTVITTSINDLPTVSNSTKETNEDIAISLDAAYFTSNVSDVDANSELTKIQITALPSHGVLKVSGTDVSVDDEITYADLANLTFAPTVNYNGTDTFDWKAHDGTAYSTSAATVTITITSVNDTPTISAISSFSKDEDFGSHNIMVTVDDADAEDLKISVSVINGDGNISIPVTITDWIPKTNGYGDGAMPMEINSVLNANGTADLNITAVDSSGASSSTVFTVTINAVDDKPVAQQMTATATAKTEDDDTGGILFNTMQAQYSDADTGPAQCGNQECATLANITLPSGLNGEVYSRADSSSSWVVKSKDASFDMAMDSTTLGNHKYVPAANFTGDDTFTWKIRTTGDDTSTGWSNTANASFIVVATHDAPDINITSSTDSNISNDTITINEDENLSNITISFSDDYTPTELMMGMVDFNDSSILDMSGVTMDTSLQASDGNITFTFTPKANTYGSVLVTLGAKDGDKNTTSSFTLQVSSVNDIPLAINFQKTINEDNNYSFSNLDPTTIYNDTNDSSQDSNETYPEIFNIVSVPAHGKLHLGNNVALENDTNVSIANLGNLVYTPAEHNFTNVTMNWKAYDGEAWTLQKVGTFNITAINDAPTNIALTSQTVSHSEGTDASVGTLSTTDVDNSSFTYTLVDGTGSDNNGKFNISGNTLHMTNPLSSSAGTYSIRIQTNDGNGGTYIKIFTITVVDDVAPVVSLLSPATNSTGFSLIGNLTITFNEIVNKGTGNIVIKKVNDNSIVETIDITSGLVTINSNVVTINPQNALPLDTQLYVEIASGGLKDTSNNDYTGISNNSDWTFRTTDTTITLNNNSVVEGRTNIGSFDTSAAFVAGTGDDDNSKFTISNGTVLTLNNNADYETQRLYSIRVEDTVTTANVIFAISVIDIYEDDNISDVDGDGIPDSNETYTEDTDGDGIPDYKDPDTDNDGLLDSTEYENGLDTDGDGIPNYKDTDSDADGIEDNGTVAGVQYEGTSDLDGDGIPNYKDNLTLDPDKKATLDALNDISDQHFLGTNVSTDEIISPLLFTKPASVINHNVDINWTTETTFDVDAGNTQYLTVEDNNTATVHRSATKDIILRLNATLSKGEHIAKKSFILTVVKENNDTEAVNRAWKAFDWFKIKKDNKYQFAVRTDLKLDTVGSDGVTISWATDYDSVVTTNGIVTRPGSDTKVTLTATFTKGSVSKSKAGTVVVSKALVNCTEVLTKAQSQLKIEDILGTKNRSADTVIDNLTLGSASTFNLEDKNNLTLTYSSNSNSLNINGAVGEIGRHTTDDKEVKLTTKIQRVGCEIPTYKAFDFIIKANDKDVIRAVVDDINDTVSTNKTMVMNFDIALGNDYDYNDATATNTFIVESNTTSIISAGGSRESTLPKQLIAMTNPNTIIENIITKLHTNGVIENIIDVKDANSDDEIKQNIIKSEKIGSTIKRYSNGSLEINATLDGRVAVIASDENGVLSHSMKTASGTGETKAVSNMKGTEVILTDSNMLKIIAPTRAISNKTYDLEVLTSSSGISTNTFKIIDNSNANDFKVMINVANEESTSTIGVGGDLTVVSKAVGGIQAVLYTDANGNSGYKFITVGGSTTITDVPIASTSSVDVNVTIHIVNGQLQIKTVTPLTNNISF